MRVLAVSLCALATLAFAADKIRIEPKFTKGDASKYKIKMNMSVGGAEAVVSYNIEKKVVEAAEKVDIEGVLTDLSITLNGEAFDAQSNNIKMQIEPRGTLLKCEGGVEGTDSSRMTLITHFFAPKEEIDKDGKWSETLEGPQGGELKKITVDGTYLGPEADAKDGFKFNIVVKEVGSTFAINNTFWVTLDGKVIKQEGKFENLPIPAAGQEATGTVKVEKG